MPKADEYLTGHWDGMDTFQLTLYLGGVDSVMATAHKGMNPIEGCFTDISR